MDVKEKNLTQEEFNELFIAVNKFKRLKQRELTEKEIEKLIYRVRCLAQS